MATLSVASELNNLANVRRFIEEAAASFTGDAEAIGDLVLAADEAVTNIIVHGYQNRHGMIEIEVKQEQGDLIICLRDWAPAFDPTAAPTPDTHAPLSQRKPGGLGVHLIRRLTDRLRYAVTPDGANELTLVKRIAA